MLLPGPEAQQLATYIGWLLHRTAGGIMAGGLFILPGVIAIMGLSYIYAAFGNVGVIEALFFGLKAAVLAIVIQAVVRVGSPRAAQPDHDRARGHSLHRHLLFNVPFPIIIISAGVIGYFGARSGRPEFAAVPHGGGKNTAAVDSMLGDELPDHIRPSVPRALRVSAIWLLLWLVPVAALLIAFGEANVFSQIALFFSKMAMVTFGGAYAVLAYVAQQAVEHYHWVGPREMLDGLGMAETTPGPLIMVLQFVGFMAAYRDPGTLSPMLAATLGGLLATWVTFHALLSLDLSGRAVRRDPARQQGISRRADGDNRRRRRRDPQSVDLVRAAHCVPGNLAGSIVRAVVRHAGAIERRFSGAGFGDRGCDRDLPFQTGHADGVGRVVRRRACCCGWRE